MKNNNLGPLSVLCLSLLSVNAMAQSAEDTTVTFPSSYFSEYTPLTVNDMVNRIPGIELILGSSSSSSGGDRGAGF